MPTRTAKVQQSLVSSVSVTPDGWRAVSGGADNVLRVWDLESGLCLRTMEGHSGKITSVSITPDGRYAISAGSWAPHVTSVGP